MNLEISQPEKLDDSSFKITINGNDFEYEISEDKDIDKVIDKINTWLERGPEAAGGLYDYIKRSFKLVGAYEEPIEEPMEPIDDTEVDIPADNVDTGEIIDEENTLEFDVHIDEDEVKISLNDWTGTFNIIETDEDFTDILHSNISEEMTLKDRTNLLIQIIRNLDADDLTDYYNLINLILNNDVNIIDDINKAEEEIEEPEEEIEDVDMDISDGLDNAEPEETEEVSTEEEPERRGGLVASEQFESGKILNEDGSEVTWASYGSPVEYDMHDQNLKEPVQIVSQSPIEDENIEIKVEDLINDEAFLEDLVNLDLSFFKISKDGEELYFIGGINNRGNKFSLSYDNNETVELSDKFDEIKDLDVCLNNMESLEPVTSYIEKLLNFVYNKELKGVDNE